MAITGAQQFDVIVIGGGPAGSQCALWLKMLGYNPVILEKSDRLGGLTNQDTNENHWIVCIPGHIGTEIAEAIRENITRHGVAHILGVQDLSITPVSAEGSNDGYTARFRTSTGHYHLQGKKLVIATGVTPKTGGFQPSEHILIGPAAILEGDYDFRGKSVAILGGGDNAAENYGLIQAQGARTITLFARTLRARQKLLEPIPQEAIITGPFTADSSTMQVNGEKFDCFVALFGWQAVCPLPDNIAVVTSSDGFIEADSACRTSVPSIFAIGECTQRLHPCITTAMADGVIAAKAIQQEL